MEMYGNIWNILYEWMFYHVLSVFNLYWIYIYIYVYIYINAYIMQCKGKINENHR